MNTIASLWHDYPLLPLLLPSGTAGLLLLLSDVPTSLTAERQEGSRGHLLLLSLLSLAATGTLCWQIDPSQPPIRALGDALLFDGLSHVAGVGICLSSAVAAMLTFAALTAQRAAVAEYLALQLLATTGALMLALAGDLLTLLLGLETMSMAAYVLAGYRRSSPAAQESALKYYLSGAFASGFVIFGMALLWGEAGRVLGEPTFSLRGIGFAIGTGGLSALGWAGVALMLAGLLFKVGLVPFHAWVPDVYQGAPTASAAFFASTIKFASFTGLTRFALATLYSCRLPAYSANALAAVALLSIVLGNLLALRQQYLKRFLAWSSVAHAGYALLGLMAVCLQPQGFGLAALYVYLLGYCSMALAAFGLFIALEHTGEGLQELTVDHMAGALRTHPGLAATAVISLFAMAGMPPTGGFVGKYLLLLETVRGGYVGVALVAALAGVIGAYGYLRVLSSLLFSSGRRPLVCLRSNWLAAALLLSAGSVLGMGVCAQPVTAWARAALVHMVP